MNSLPLFTSLICSAYMFGVIWLIQLIHYPAFFSIEPAKFVDFHRRHSAVMGFLVAPAMILELLAALWLVSLNMNGWSVINLVLVLALWGLTFFVSVPLHNKLAKGFKLDVIHKLVSTNWPRTSIWTAKLIIVAYWFLIPNISY
jgi:hypothetical protein